MFLVWDSIFMNSYVRKWTALPMHVDFFILLKGICIVHIRKCIQNTGLSVHSIMQLSTSIILWIILRPATLVEMTLVETDFPTNAMLKWADGSKQCVFTKKKGTFILMKKI